LRWSRVPDSLGRVRILAASTIVLVALILAPLALAYRAPTSAEKTQIVAAVHTYLIKSNCTATHTCHPRITSVRVSLANQHYATAFLNVPRVGVATVLLHKLYGTWRVTDLGSSDVGCGGKAPKSVRVDLELTCPGGK
jgi:hypothetical protein